MWRAVASNTLTLFILVLVLAAGLLAWARQEFTAAGPLAAPICLKVDKGESLASVSARLEEAGAVRDARLFRLAARYGGQASGLKFGSYLLPAGASGAAVLEALTAGGASSCGREVNLRIGVTASEIVLRELKPESGAYEEVLAFDPSAGPAPADYLAAAAEDDLRFRVTLAEGVTSWQVGQALTAADFLSGEVTALPPEGHIAPGSYEIVRGAARQDLLAAMGAKQEALIAALWPGRAEGLPFKTPEEALTLASIVEKETGVAEERALVASVFLNRLRQGIKLQTDPSVIYGITKGEGVLGRGLRQSELRRATPYNTYVIDGLPPTPIANPGEASIQAVLHPEVSDYLFFVADGTGGHVFAKTLEEHNRNVAAWRKIEAERAKAAEEGAAPEGASNP